jgi:amidohydrolase
MSDELRRIIDTDVPELVSIRRDLHAHPELAYQEQRTSEVVQRELGRAGVEFRAGLGGGTGVLAHIGGGPGRDATAVGLRADMDALPIREESTLPYRSSCDGVMHACGHDGHTAILLGAARALATVARSRRGGLPRPVTFVFQPAEEGGAGAQRMIADGCMDGSRLGPPVEQMFGLHGWPRIPLGTVATRTGPMLAAADTFELIIGGLGSHAAWPHVGRDPIVAGSAVVTALQTIRSRNVGPLEPLVVSVTRFEAGTTHNVLPGEARLQGTVRTLSSPTRELVERRIGEIASGVAAAHGCRATLRYTRGYPPTVNHPDAVAIFREVASRAIGPDRVAELPEPVMGAEDFAYYGERVPACFFVLGLVPPGVAEVPELHQPTFDFNDQAIPLGVELLCRLALHG